MSGPANGNVPVHPTRAPVLTALAAQVLAFILCFGLALAVRRGGGPVFDLPLILAGQGVVAAVLALKWGLPRWWVPLQMVLPAAAGAALMLELPSWVFLATFAILALVFWNASGERVPLYLSNRRTWSALAQLLPANASTFIDIGCGIGGTLTSLARAKPDTIITGIESAPLPFAIAWMRVKVSGLPNIELLYGDFWKLDLKAYDVVYAFLSPAPMPALHKKVRAEMTPGSCLISNSFTVPDNPPDETHGLDDRRTTQLLIWRM
jgi:hypothetical protein